MTTNITTCTTVLTVGLEIESGCVLSVAGTYRTSAGEIVTAGVPTSAAIVVISSVVNGAWINPTA